jgi:hypothetical protein
LKYPALNPLYNLKSRIDLIDYDYVSKLSPEEREYLNSFTEEYVNADFNHGGERVHPLETYEKVVKVSGKVRTVDIYKQESEKRNNARNSCVLTKAKISNKLTGIEELDNLEAESFGDPEDSSS